MKRMWRCALRRVSRSSWPSYLPILIQRRVAVIEYFFKLLFSIRSMHAHLRYLRLYSATCTHTCKFYCIRTGIRTLHTWTRRARECSCLAGCACQSLYSARAPRLLPAAKPPAPAAAKLAVATSSETASAHSTTALHLRPLYPVHAIRRRAKTVWPASQ